MHAPQKKRVRSPKRLVDAVNKKQANFAKNLALGLSGSQAAKLAGYSQPDSEATRLLKSSAVRELAHSERVRRFEMELAPKAMRVLDELLMSDNEEIKLKVAKYVLETVGHSREAGAKLATASGSKPLNEMTPSELREFIGRGQRAIEVLSSQEVQIVPRGTTVPQSVDNDTQVVDDECCDAV